MKELTEWPLGDRDELREESKRRAVTCL